MTAQRELMLVPKPPQDISSSWINGFVERLHIDMPALPIDDAFRFALLAHDSTFLLDPAEAANWWCRAIESQVGM